MTPAPTNTEGWAGTYGCACVSDNLHIAVCNAVVIMNMSIDIARSPEGRKARDILRQALIDYADEYTDKPVTEQERELVARRHRNIKRIQRRP